jgi:RNA polymerase sigma factor (sigma-70 family)
MVTRESFMDDPDQVEHLIKWWVSRTDARYHRVRRRGTVREFIHDVWLKLLQNFRDGKEVDCSISTVIINQCHWELSETNRGGIEWDFNYRLRNARHVKRDDRICGCEAAIDYAHARELDRAIARVLCTLTYREAIIIRARYGLLGDKEMSLEQVAKPLKVCRERIRQIESKALKKIQHHSRARRLIKFVDEETHKRLDDDLITVEDTVV